MTSYPLFRLTVALSVGIFLSDRFLPIGSGGVWPLAGGLFVTVVLMAWLHFMGKYRSRFAFGMLSCVAFALIGAILTQQEKCKVHYDWPKNEVAYIGTLAESPVRTLNSWRLIVNVEAAHISHDWKPVGKKAVVYQIPDSTCRPLNLGDKICFYARVVTPNSAKDESVNSGYGSYLLRNGVGGTAVVYPGKWAVISVADNVKMTFKQKALLWRENVVAIFQSWQLPPDVIAVISALTVGDKSALSSDLKSAYSTAGTSHVLALSGLHVGLLSAMLLLVLSPLRRFPGGRWLLVCLSVGTLWLYAFFTGLSPSVVRAVCMFSFYEIAFMLSENRFSGFPPLVLTAFCMLVYCPFYLFDVSFQLSFVAVFSIFSFYPYIVRLLDIRSGVLRFLYKTVALSFSAQLGTLPLVLYYFGSFPVYFLLANIVVTPLAICILLFTLLALIFSSLPLLMQTFLFPLEWSVRILNATMEWVSLLPGSQITSIHISALQSALMLLSLYILFLLLSKYSFHRMVCMLVSLNIWMVSIFMDNFTREDSLVFHQKSVYLRCGREVSRLNSSHNIYKVGDLHIGLMRDARWAGFVSSHKETLHYVYLCRGYRGDIAALLHLFKVHTVILDSSLNEEHKKQLKQECMDIGIPFVDLSGKGSYSILL